ncbi:MAG: MotA/TolQ/ExbB proton channel family protein [Candidatus Omnitrophica bacterium]|nr:MotA/TolQ/ExbB proton channel family protein [Candidatus Omnitrophota bacterium]
MSLMQIISSGGVTMYVLILFSVISLAIILERLLYYSRRSGIPCSEFMDYVRVALEKGYTKKAEEVCKHTDTPFASVVHAGLLLQGHDEKKIRNAMERQSSREVMSLERFTDILGTIGSISVYVGLFGTVIGIIRAFRDIASSGSGGISVVISGISEALVCTAAGLCVAIPAVIAYNFFVKRIDTFIADMELCSSELLDIVKTK